MNADIMNIKDGKHADEVGIIINKLENQYKVLTLEGDTHYYDKNGYEIKRRT